VRAGWKRCFVIATSAIRALRLVLWAASSKYYFSSGFHCIKKQIKTISFSALAKTVSQHRFINTFRNHTVFITLCCLVLIRLPKKLLVFVCFFLIWSMLSLSTPSSSAKIFSLVSTSLSCSFRSLTKFTISYFLSWKIKIKEEVKVFQFKGRIRVIKGFRKIFGIVNENSGDLSKE
jgi:hypothetical protein